MTTGYDVCRAQIKEQVMSLLQSSEELNDDAVYDLIEQTAQKYAGFRLLRPRDKERMI